MKRLKKNILLSLVAPLLFSLLSFSNAVAGDVITVRVHEKQYGKHKIEVYANDKVSEMLIEKDTHIIEAISKTLEKYCNEGYKIEASNAIMHAGAVLVTTYILTK